ncbi:MerR family transcriptional regulator [Acetobacter suratthaniensis]|uniref:MerR family transcriptional regulator n=2 Tax=Acetobacter suratthaniensis TaxID=1502841 RepID=A0ABS3LJ84_9PROT|nr:MerR family transcriptional regulator [Acetobacter suratthaniensis]
MGLDELEKAPDAFRTISEVADELHVPQHTLRLWESQFQQVQPVKRAGGRRYYRQDDIALLRHISDLLYTQGYTVKGVQRLLDSGMVVPMPARVVDDTAAESVDVAEALQHENPEVQDIIAESEAQSVTASVQEEAAPVAVPVYDAHLRAELEGILVELLAIRQKLVV